MILCYTSIGAGFDVIAPGLVATRCLPGLRMLRQALHIQSRPARSRRRYTLYHLHSRRPGCFTTWGGFAMYWAGWLLRLHLAHVARRHRFQ